MDWQNILIVAVIGIVAGLLSGMLGIGGAIIVVPALVMLLHYSQPMAQGTALGLMVLPVGALATYQYYQKGFIDIKAAVIMAVFFFISGYFGAKLAVHIPQVVLKKIFSVMLILIAIRMWMTAKT